MYAALYRKWRPLVFSDVIGQRHVTETLQKELLHNRISHAYLFTGTRGTGKTTCAKILARAVNCENLQDGNPCNVCPPCRGILDGSILDVLEIDAASHSGVDNIRALRDESVYAPASIARRVYIIDEVHMLSPGAFNALLTILEEPPSHVLFILATTETHKVLPTILSRCQRFAFRRISEADMADHLTDIAAREQVQLAPAAAAWLARLSDGSVRDALSLLDQCLAQVGPATPRVLDTQIVQDALGLAGQDQMYTLAQAIARRDCTTALSEFSALYEGGRDPASLLDELSQLFRDVLLLQVCPRPSLTDDAPETRLKTLLPLLPLARLNYAFSLLLDTQLKLRTGGRRFDAELCLLRLCEERLSDDISALSARVARLEDMLSSGAAFPPTQEPRPALDPPPWENDAPVRAAATQAPSPESGVPWEDVPWHVLDEPASPPPGTSMTPPWEDDSLSTVPPPDVPSALAPAPSETSPLEGTPLPADTDLAERLLSACADKLSPLVMAMLKDAPMTLRENRLEIAVDAFVATRLNQKELIHILAEQAETLLGHTPAIHFTAPTPPKNQDPLSALKQRAGGPIRFTD